MFAPRLPKIRALLERRLHGGVYTSASTAPLENLPLEEWLMSAIEAGGGGESALMLWRNRPSVIIGRTQNPWLECDLAHLRARGVPVVRRRSGGGTVYHDQGNLNCTFIGPRNAHDPARNARLLASAIERATGVVLRTTERSDLFYGQRKLSGSAFRLDSKYAYHHCTLLIQADLTNLERSLQPSIAAMQGKGVASIRSRVVNLRDLAPAMADDVLLAAIAREFSREHGLPANVPPRLLNPADAAAFPGLADIVASFNSWEWTFGQTPPFSLTDTLQLPVTGLSAVVKLSARRGTIEDLTLTLSDPVLQDFAGHVASRLVNVRIEKVAFQDAFSKLCDDLNVASGTETSDSAAKERHLRVVAEDMLTALQQLFTM